MRHYPTTMELVDQHANFDEYEDIDGSTFFRDADGDFVETSACDDCTVLFDSDNEGTWVDSRDAHVCDSCRDDDYFFCEDHEGYAHDHDSRNVEGDNAVCLSCFERRYFYCDSCDEYVHEESSHYENHEEEGCECDAPGQHFSVRNGGVLLDNDESATISLPSGFVSDEGIGQIARLIRESAPPADYNLWTSGDESQRDEYRAAVSVQQDYNYVGYSFADAIGTEWQTKEGNFTKRLSRYAYKARGLKLSPATISAIGNVARAHSDGADVTVEFTRDLNQSASDFYHDDSCWWQSYYESRCALKSNGGIGMRTFEQTEHDDYAYVQGPWAPDFAPYANGGRMPTAYMPTGRKMTTTSVSGRAWVMPLRWTGTSFEPTFTSDGADAYVVFNGYGALSGYSAARIVAQMNGMTYRKVEFCASPMYVNSDAGYLVTSESLAEMHTDGNVRLYLDSHSNLYSREASASLVNANA